MKPRPLTSPSPAPAAAALSRPAARHAAAAPASAVRPRAAALRVVQPRAQATRDSLLAAGRQLLSTRDFDAVSIAELAAANRLSVGSFYGRFRDKEAFFAVLQQQVTAEWLSLAEAMLRRHAGADAPRLIQSFCELVVDTFRRDAGFFRAALKHASTQPDRWTPIKEAGMAVATALEAALAPALTRLDPAERGLRVRFAVQMLYGTCVNAVLNDPGPLRLDDSRLAHELAHVMSLYLGLPAGKPRGLAHRP